MGTGRCAADRTGGTVIWGNNPRHTPGLPPLVGQPGEAFEQSHNRLMAADPLPTEQPG